MTAALTRPLIGITYNSAELSEFLLWRHMFHGLVAAGGTPIAIDCLAAPPQIDALVTRLDGLLLSGGGDIDPTLYGADPTDPLLDGVNTHRDKAEQSALAAARARHRPVLAICRGAQLVNATLGGTLYVDLARDRPTELAHRHSEDALGYPLHDVNVVTDSLLSDWVGHSGVLKVNSQHHQGLRELAPALSPSAFSPDGLIEAFELRSEHVVGVQWHPEVLWAAEPSALEFLSRFVWECQ